MYNSFYKLKYGNLSSAERSTVLANLVMETQEEWDTLRYALLNKNKFEIFNSCKRVSEISFYFEFYGVIEMKQKLDRDSFQDIYDQSIYEEMLRTWCIEICKLRTVDINLKKPRLMTA